MRDIKFRGIATVNDKCNNIMVGDFVYGCFVETNIDCQILFGDGEQISIDGKTIGQFTGLKDKNGTEIYEGDIANCPDEFKYKCIMDGRGCFVFCNPDNRHDFYFLDDMDWEIIGSTHQNPELIK